MASASVPEFSESVLKHLKLKHEEQTKKGDFDDFLKKLAVSENSAPLSIKVDTGLTISQYFISSSHNTYLTGNQLWSKASTDAYKDVLKRGCRCIEIDVWDGGSASASSSDYEENGNGKGSEMKQLTGMVKKGLTRFRSGSSAKDSPTAGTEVEKTPADTASMPTPWRTESNREEPRVLHGYTATKEVPFRRVCETIRDYAFVSTELPLIVSLEVHCNHEQQTIMVEIMKDYWKQYLVSMPQDFSDDTPLPPLKSLKKKILIKVKYSPPKRKQTKSHKRTTSKEVGERESSDDEGQVDSGEKGKIIEALSNLGVYVRSCHFNSLEQSEASIPTHVFALSEKKLTSLLEQSRDALFTHNLSYLMRAYPKGTRVRSSNLDPAPFWRQGIQMVALNWQQMNAAMMLNEAMFSGTGGWVQKPETYRKAKAEQPPIKRVGVDLSVRLLAAQKLDAEARTTPNVYVKCELHVESKTEKEAGLIPEGGKNKGGEWKRRSSTSHSKDPDFAGEVMEFKAVEDVMPALSFVRYVDFFGGCWSPKLVCAFPSVTAWPTTMAAVTNCTKCQDMPLPPLQVMRSASATPEWPPGGTVQAKS